MKLKMIIADDEYNVREGLKDIVRWDDLGIEIVALAADGQEAYELCLELKPDILLTDIRMPIMDGLDVALKLKEQGELPRIIIISGAQDFNYAQTAINLNADGYILKPIRIPELQDTVRKVVSSIHLERNRERKNELLKQQLHENMPMLREKFLTNLFQGLYRSEQEIRNKLEFFQININTCGSWTTAVLKIDDYEEAIARYSEENKQLLTFSINNIAEEVLSRNQGGISFSMNENEYVILFNTLGRKSDYFLEVCQEIISCINTYLKLTLCIGLGDPVPSLRDLHQSYQEAKSVIAYKFYTGKNSILQISDYKLDKGSVEYPKLYESQAELINFMKLGNQEEARNTVGELFNSLCANHNLPIEYVQSICVELINMATRTLYELGENIHLIVKDFSMVIRTVYDIHDALELRDSMQSFFEELTLYFVQKHNQKNTRTIQKIQTIISQKYMENLNLTMISEEVFLSPNYMSMIFKQETGENLTEYITKVRMEAAKELLKAPDLKILEVAEMVGYENTTYFSTVFKKYTGMHPQKYRSLFTHSS